MVDLIKRDGGIAGANLPAGIAFDIEDLILTRIFAMLNQFNMVIRLDHGIEEEEYEEVIEFHSTKRRGCWVLMWRDATGIFVQPVLGRRRRHASVAEALKSLLGKSRVPKARKAAVGKPPGGVTER